MKKRAEELTYKVYVTDALQVLTSNTARFAGGAEIKQRFADVLLNKAEETRTPEEIKTHIKKRLKEIERGG